jgi:hypothetical protein
MALFRQLDSRVEVISGGRDRSLAATKESEYLLAMSTYIQGRRSLVLFANDSLGSVGICRVEESVREQ